MAAFPVLTSPGIRRAIKKPGSTPINFDKNANGEDNPDGCTDARGNVRKGQITISWSGGRWFNPDL